MKKTPSVQSPSILPTGPLQLTAFRQNLTAALKITSAAIPSRSTLPILSHVLLKADAQAQTLTLSATNLEIGLIVRVGARVSASGAIAVPFKTFSDLLNSLDVPDIDLLAETRAMSLAITGARTKSHLKGLDASEFPELNIRLKSFFSVPASDFKQLIRRSTFSAATDEARPVLTGVCFTVKNGLATLAAADGFRLAEANHALEAAEVAPVVIPSRVLDKLAGFMSDDDSLNIGLIVPDNQSAATQIVFETGPLTLICQLLEGQFPDYKSLVPESAVNCLVNRLALTRALKTARVFAQASAFTTRLSFSPTALTISAVSAEAGDGQIVLTEADGYSFPGEPLELGVNCDFLAELVAAAETEQVSLGLTANTKPMLVTPVGANGYRSVIMPMMLNK